MYSNKCIEKVSIILLICRAPETGAWSAPETHPQPFPFLHQSVQNSKENKTEGGIKIHGIHPGTMFPVQRAPPTTDSKRGWEKVENIGFLPERKREKS